MITSTGRQKDLQRILDNLDHATYVLDGNTQIIPFYDTKIENDILHIYLYLDESVKGNITNFKVIDKNGDVYIDRADSINKSDLKGVYVAFSYKYDVKEVPNVLR
ncbi:hypothetical protein QYF48_12235 [Brevibacillus agri]|uniref:hypothetical protein n=1 Tax=Brevibacillus agri TaxID=51101 RepID=UPI0025B68D5F|nr:hypothetical protein [Brevibacillus agri]MDN4093584.1 hypothetical protein [Brevibacillus agri]